MIFITEVTIIDSIMGSGKTSWSIDYINHNTDENILYITPFLDEIERLKTRCPDRQLLEPVHNGKGKLVSLNELLSCQEDIASTHSLFKMIDDESKFYIDKGNYILILDEVLSVIDIVPIKKGDLKLLTESGCIKINSDGFVEWNREKKDYDTSFNEIKRLAENNNLICINGVMLIWRYPPEIFRLFKKVYVLTYLFESSILKNYFDLYEIKYTKKSIIRTNDNYELTDYFIPSTKKYTDLINIYEGKLNTNFHQKLNGLSSSWFDAKHNSESIKQIQKNIYNYFTNIVSADSDSVLWTTYEKAENNLKGKGYSKRFIACNCKSTNKYADVSNLCYALNLYLHPSITGFFMQRGININQDLYALSEMLQWIWRSRVRNGKSINIYVPSIRMRNLLQNWLNGDIYNEYSNAS